MPQFNMTDDEVSVLADYLSMVMQTPAVDLASVDTKPSTPQMANLGKELYEVKYQCQSCHTIGSAGGYVGPNLTNVGNWINPAWMEGWLKNPQSLVPEAIEPHRDFTDEERTALTAYLMTLKQNATAPAGGGSGRGQ
jgi:cytochrome c2